LSSRNYTKRLEYWIPALLWAAVILSASSEVFSAEHSAHWLSRIIKLPPREFAVVHFLIRKLAHLTEYAVLGGLLFRALRGDEDGWRMRWAVTAVALAACVAVTDEWHQLYVPSRTGSGWDVVLDTVGAALAQCVAAGFSRPKRAG
jgi:VanZ family protein